jgi:hypothetical protein
LRGKDAKFQTESLPWPVWGCRILQPNTLQPNTVTSTAMIRNDRWE